MSDRDERVTGADPLSTHALERLVVDFVRAASTEITTHDEPLLPELRTLLDADTTIYIAHTPRATVDEVVRTAIRVQALGFPACPHVGARRLRSRAELDGVLGRMRDGGVQRMLLIGGDVERPAGPFAGALDVLETGATVDHDIESIGVAGYPEGHKGVDGALLWDALARKQEFSEHTGTRMHIVSQFGFDPDAVTTWSREVAERGIRLPIHVGIAGPVPLPRLIKYAIHCGIGASLNALMRNAGPLTTLAAAGVGGTAATPDRMLIGVLRGREERQAVNIVKPHFFSLGGALETARWLRALRTGAFEVDAGGTGLTARDVP